MDRQFILSEIQRTAQSGKALGQRRFADETGIKEHEWCGRYWARWGDAVIEAGLLQSKWTAAYEETHVLDSLLDLARKLGHFPTTREAQLESRVDPLFPSKNPIRRIGDSAQLRDKLIQRCSSDPRYVDLLDLVSAIPIRAVPTDKADGGVKDSASGGYVYLISGQGAYKIGFSRAPYRRSAEIATASARGAELLHLIATDDPEGIEGYWHHRFRDKRISGQNKQSGEWFALSSEDIKSFKRLKRM